MRRRYLWSAAVFAAVPFVVFACGGGRSDIDLLLDNPDAGAGKAGASGKVGGAGSVAVSGQGGATPSGGTAGAGAQGGSGQVCVPGQQLSCACPGTSQTGVQVCAPDGKGLGACMGCPGNQGGAGGSTGQGGSAQGGSTGQAGKEPADGGADFFDALPFPLPDSGPVGECVGCLQENCDDQINKCYNDPDCVQGIQCAITQCFGGNILGGGAGGPGGPGGGGLDFGCLLQCFNGDPTAVFAAVQAFQCITQTCGGQCGGGILGDGGFPLGGLGGGPGPGPGPGGAEPMFMQGVRVPTPAEVPGYPKLQQALTPSH